MVWIENQFLKYRERCIPMKKWLVITLVFVMSVIVTVLLVVLPDRKTENEETQHSVDLQQYYKNSIGLDELQEKLNSDESVLVYFYSPQCPYCTAMTPLLMPIVEEKHINIALVDVLENQDVWNTYNLTGTPTTIYFQNGKEVDRMEGFVPKDMIKSFVDYYFQK